MAPGILFILIWASAFPAARFLVLEWPPLWALATRFWLAAPLLAVIVVWRESARGVAHESARQEGRERAQGEGRAGRSPWPSRGDAARLMAMGAFGTGGYLGCAWIAMASTPSGIVALLAATAPLFVAVGERALRGRPLGARAGAGLLLGWLGVALLGGFRAAGFAPAAWGGILLALAGALSQALGMLAFAPARERVAPWTANLGQTMSAALLLLPLALLLEPMPRAGFGAIGAAALIYSVLVVGLAGYALYFVMLKRLPAPRAAALQLLAPPVAALLGWLLLGERLLATDLLGGAITLAGLALLFSARR